MEALRNFFSLKRILYCLNQWLMPKRAAKFAKRASCEVRYLELFNNGRMPLRFQGSPMVSKWMKQNVYYSRMFKELRCIFLGHVGRRNTSSGQKYPPILYVKPSNKGIITLLFFQFQLRKRFI